MKKFSLLTVLFCTLQFSASANGGFRNIILETDTLPSTTVGQDTLLIKDENGNTKVFEKVDIEAQFQGGDDEWRQFLVANINANTPVGKGAPVGTYMVVEKRYKVVEEVHLIKHTTETPFMQQVTLKKQKVDIERTDSHGEKTKL